MVAVGFSYLLCSVDHCNGATCKRNKLCGLEIHGDSSLPKLVSKPDPVLLEDPRSKTGSERHYQTVKLFLTTWTESDAELHELCACCWDEPQGKLLQDLRDTVILIFCQNKGESWTALLSIARKIVAIVFVNGLLPSIAADHLPVNQRGFRANRGTNDIRPQTVPRAEQRSIYKVC